MRALFLACACFAFLGACSTLNQAQADAIAAAALADKNLPPLETGQTTGNNLATALAPGLSASQAATAKAALDSSNKALASGFAAYLGACALGEVPVDPALAADDAARVAALARADAALQARTTP